MIANIVQMQIFPFPKYELRCHKRSHKVILNFENHLFPRYIFLFNVYLLQTLQHYEDAIFSLNPQRSSMVI